MDNNDENKEIHSQIDSNEATSNNEAVKEELETSKESNNQESDLQDSRFKDGQLLRFVNVRFPGNAKSFRFSVGKRNLTYGQQVVAMSDRGMDVGYINSFPFELPFEKSMLPIKSISKIAGRDDLEKKQELIDKEKQAEIKCNDLIDKHKLDMILTHVEIIQFGKKAVFYFNAPDRVDFRNLVKDLVSELRMRIELRQITVRDRSAAVGAISACGRQNCCSSFLKNYGNVSIKTAKNQNLALIPGKLNGACGQIKCCIRFEDNVYSDKRKRLPKEGSFIHTRNGDLGKVTKLHILADQFDMITDKGKICRYHSTEFNLKKSIPPTSWKFPTSFEHVSNETKEIIGTVPDSDGNCDNCSEKELKTEITPPAPIKTTVSETSTNQSKNQEVSSQQSKKSNYHKKRNNRYNKNKNKNSDSSETKASNKD